MSRAPAPAPFIAGARRALARLWRWRSCLDPRLWVMAVLALSLSCLGGRAFVPGRRAPGELDGRHGA